MTDPVRYHEPVLLQECVEGLSIHSDGVYVDGTLGGGGHFRAILDRLGSQAVAVGIDRDPEALREAEKLESNSSARVVVVNARFSEIDRVLQENQLTQADGILLDLGVSSRQIDAPDRGFSYTKSASLDMRMNPGDARPASEVIEQSTVDELSTILSEYGEIRNPTRMARALKNWVKTTPLATSDDLKACLMAEYGKVPENKVLAKLFQALRIAVNQELQELSTFLAKAESTIRPSGRLAVISYHSLEDRLVKRFMSQAERTCVCPPELPVCQCDHRASFKRITRHAVKPGPDEIKRNPRARSARLRIAQRLEEKQVA